MFNVEVNWFLNLFRTILAAIDTVVYTLISFLFRAVFNLANFELVGFYESFEQRVYVILGIFMLFKVTISLISYLVNPEKITDKEQGISKVVVRIITVLVMLIALPTFFDLMTEAQNKLLPVIPRVIVGTANTLTSEDASGIANNMATTMLQGFAHLKEGCQGTEISSPGDILANINNICSDTSNTYAYDYLPIVSTIVGIAMCYVVFSLCISVAIRAFKLIILRMMAPVPIISYVDPKSAKDGAFSHWTKTFISTWAELFINIGLIYFIIYIIDFILSGAAWTGFFDGISGEYAFIDGTILLAFVIIGLLFFAKSAPQFIMDALGIKNKGGFMRMLSYGASAAGMAGSVASSLRARKEYNEANPLQSTGNVFKDKAMSALRSVGTVGGSLFSGLASGVSAGNAAYKSDKPSLMTGIDALQKYNAQNLSRINSGSTALGRIGAMGQTLLMGETTADINERRIKNMEAFNSALGAIGKRASGEMVKQDWTYGDSGFTIKDNYGKVVAMEANYKTFMAAKNAAASAGEKSFNYKFKYTDSTGKTHEIIQNISMEDANMNEGLILKNNEDDYIRKASVKGVYKNSRGEDVYDQVLSTYINDANEKSTIQGFKVTGRSSVKSTQDELDIKITDAKRENEKHVANRHGQGNKGN